MSDWSNWALDGQRVTGVYLGVTVTGLVESSRVKYGGMVVHTVNLDHPVQFPWRTEPATRVLLNQNELVSVA